MKLPEEVKPNQDIFIPMTIGPDGFPQVAPGFGDFKPEHGQLYDCEDLGDNLFNCTIVQGPCSGESLVTNDAMKIKQHIEGGQDGSLCSQKKPDTPTGGVKDPVVLTTEESPESGVAEATTETTSVTEEDEEEDDEDMTTDSPPLSSMSYQEICGTTPWVNKTTQKTPRAGRKRGSKHVFSKSFWRQFKRKGRIVNGERAEYGEWPWQVSLRQWRTGENGWTINYCLTMFVFSNLPA